MPSNVRRNLILSLDPNSGVPALKLELRGPQRLPLGVALGTPGYDNVMSFVPKGGLGPPFNITILSGAIATGCTFSSSTGLWSGTPSALGDFNFVAQVSDGTNTTPVAFHVEVFGGLYPVFGHYAPLPAVKTRTYSYQVLFADATGSSAGITYALSPGSGALPGGITLSSAGLLNASSVTASAGTFWFSVRGTKGSATVDQAMSITVRNPLSSVAISLNIDATLSTMLVGQPVDTPLTLKGSGSPFGQLPITWSVSANSLAPGLTLYSMKDGSARIRGTPTAVTNNTFVQPSITATDASGATKTFTFGAGGVGAMSVNSSLPAISIAGHFYASAADGTPIDVDYLAQFFGHGGDGNATISSGTTTLSRHMYYDTLTISGTGKIDTRGFDIYCKTLLDLTNAGASAIYAGNGSASLPGTASGNEGPFGTNGGSAAIGTSTAGNPGNPGGALGVGVSAGAKGGIGGAGSSGAGASPSAVAPTFTASPSAGDDVFQVCPNFGFAENDCLPIGGGVGGCSGGAGGGSGSASGGTSGGGGGGGGRVRIFARTIARGASTAASCIDVRGWAGSNGAVGPGVNRGAGAGGGGGGGGYAHIRHAGLTGTSAANAINITGGNGGNGGNSGGSGSGVGQGGDAAPGGLVLIENVLLPPSTVVQGPVGVLHGVSQTGATATVSRVAL